MVLLREGSRLNELSFKQLQNMKNIAPPAFLAWLFGVFISFCPPNSQ